MEAVQMMKFTKKICRFVAVPMVFVTLMSGCAFAAPKPGPQPNRDDGRRMEQMRQPGQNGHQPEYRPGPVQQRTPQPRPGVQPAPGYRPQPRHESGRSSGNSTASSVGLLAIGAVIGGLIAGTAAK